MRQKLRSIRISSKFTQEEIASLIGINRATYTNIELGKKNPSLNVAIKIKNILKYSNDDIFHNEDISR